MRDVILRLSVARTIDEWSRRLLIAISSKSLLANGTSTRAILITKNVFLGGVWVFNIQVWDTARTGLSILKNVGKMMLKSERPA